jgi:hypothetical protein
MEAENRAPTRKHAVRTPPDVAKPRATEPSGFFSATEVTNTTTASGTTMTAMVRNCRLMYAMAPSWMNPAISCWASLPGSAASTPCISA